MMQRFRGLLLNVWREACRHIEIQESTPAIARQIARHLPIGQIVVRRIQHEPAGLVTVATSNSDATTGSAEERRDLDPPQLQRLVRWCRKRRLLCGDRMTNRRRCEILQYVVPEGISGPVIVAPLIDGDILQGVLLLTAADNGEVEDAHRELMEALLEPFFVALSNDRLVRELAALRASAEADRGALLRRLGRKDLVETIVGEQSGLKQVLERVELVAHSDLPVLILGETGTGKELVARALHGRSLRPEGPFIRVNCGAIPPELIDSQLFGHERGSFTGADQDRQGWFARADGGTLFLDEIGELPLAAQIRFLRVLQDGFVEPLGAARAIHVNVRVIAATHRDLPAMIHAGKFREDLWYRLAVFPILLPPLRERREDIPELAYHFAERAAARFGLAFAPPTSEDLHLLQSYTWPGNIRELGAVIDRAAILGEGNRLEIATAIGTNIDWTARSAPNMQAQATQVRGRFFDGFASLDQAIRHHIEAVLQSTSGQIEGRRGAAALLQVNPHTLRARMRKLGIDWSKYRESPESTHIAPND